MNHKIINTGNYLLIVNDSEIKEGDYVLSRLNEIVTFGKNYLATLYKKIISHLPLNNSPILEGVDLLPPLEDDVERLSEEWFQSANTERWGGEELGFVNGYNKAKEKYKYTEEEMKRIYEKGYSAGRNELNSRESDKIKYDYIQSLQQPKMPVGFECEMKCGRCYSTNNECWSAKECSRGNDFKDIPKTTTNSQGLTQWVGEYTY